MRLCGIGSIPIWPEGRNIPRPSTSVALQWRIRRAGRSIRTGDQGASGAKYTGGDRGSLAGGFGRDRDFPRLGSTAGGSTLAEGCPPPLMAHLARLAAPHQPGASRTRLRPVPASPEVPRSGTGLPFLAARWWGCSYVLQSGGADAGERAFVSSSRMSVPAPRKRHDRWCEHVGTGSLPPIIEARAPAAPPPVERGSTSAGPASMRRIHPHRRMPPRPTGLCDRPRHQAKPPLLVHARPDRCDYGSGPPGRSAGAGSGGTITTPLAGSGGRVGRGRSRHDGHPRRRLSVAPSFGMWIHRPCNGVVILPFQ